MMLFIISLSWLRSLFQSANAACSRTFRHINGSRDVCGCSTGTQETSVCPVHGRSLLLELPVEMLHLVGEHVAQAENESSLQHLPVAAPITFRRD